MYFVDGIRTPEIARRLDIPVGTVTYRLSQARAKLKGELDTMYEKSEKISPDFEITVMEKIQKLRNYYADNGTMDGISEALCEAETMVERLAEGTSKRAAYSHIHTIRYVNVDDADVQYEKAVAAAEKANDMPSLLQVVSERFWRLQWNKSHAKSVATDFITNDAIPLLRKHNHTDGVAEMVYYRGAHILDAYPADFAGAARDFEEVTRLVGKENIRHAHALAFLRAIELWQSKIEYPHITPMSETFIFGDRLHLKDGALQRVSQPGYFYVGGPNGEWPTHVYAPETYAVSQFWAGEWGCLFYDLNMAMGETYTDQNGANTMTRISDDETVTVPAGTFDNCLHIVTTHANQGSWDFDFTADVWYAPNAGMVKVHLRSTGAANRPVDEIRVLDEYEIGGGDGYFPLAAGNRWSYTIPALSDYVYQRSEVAIDWTDGEYANCSTVNMYGMKKGVKTLCNPSESLCAELDRLLSNVRNP
jgi:DNA-directed RNA polymerase specialized sigma subunit, sigma24 homolog